MPQCWRDIILAVSKMSSAKQTKQKSPAELASEEFFSRVKASIVFGFIVGVPAGAFYGMSRGYK